MAGARADEWSATPIVREQVIYNSNPLFYSGEQQGALGSLTDLGLDLGWRTETSSATFTPKVRINRYDNQQDVLNNEYQYYNLNASTATERARFGLKASLIDDTVNSTEAIESGGQGLIQRLGFRNVQIPRTTWNVTPSASYVLTERVTGGLDLNYSSTNYDDSRPNGYVDYDFYTVNGSLGYALSERDTLSGILYYSSYDRPLLKSLTEPLGLDEISATTNSIGLQAGYDRRLTETMRFNLAAGAVRSEFTFDPFQLPDGTRSRVLAVLGARGVQVFEVPEDTTKYGPLVNATLTEQLERTRWDVSLDHILSPTSDGFLVERDQLRGSLRHEWTPLTSGRFALVALKDKNLGERVAVSDRNYGRVEAGLSYRLTSYWTLSADYRYMYEKYTDSDSPALSNAFWVSIGYQGDKWAVSR